MATLRDAPAAIALAPAVEAYVTSLRSALRDLSRADVARTVQVVFDAWRDHRKLLVAGNGGSAATASHAVNDLCKATLTPGWPRLRALSLSDNVPLMTAWANDESYDRCFLEPLVTWADPGDVFLAISTSGNSPNIVEAAREARSLGVRVVGFTGRTGGALAELCDVAVHVPDDHIGRQEDVHHLLNHVVTGALRALSEDPAEDPHAFARSWTEDYLSRFDETLAALSQDDVARAGAWLLETWRSGAKVLVCGNGGSAATAAHVVNDLGKLTITDGWPRFRAVSLCDNVPLMTAWANDAAYDEVFLRPLESWAEDGDVLLAISTSGSSPNVLAAAREASRRGLRTIAFVGDRGGRLATLADLAIRIPSDQIGRQEDGHMVLNHILANVLRDAAAAEAP